MPANTPISTPTAKVTLSLPTATTTEIHAAIKKAMDDVRAVEKDFNVVLHEVAHWLEREFHLVPKTAEEKTVAQNTAAARATEMA